MEIITRYGNIEFDELEKYDLSVEVRDFIKNQKEASEIFFSNEIDLTKVEKYFLDLVQELVEIAITENKFSHPEKAFSLAEYLETDIIDIDEDNENTFSVGSEQYMVLTDSEADELAIEMNVDILNEIGLFGLNSSTQDYIYSNLVKTDWFDQYMDESNRNYANENMSYAASDAKTYVNGLHEKMVELGIMDTPEWPDEDDYGDDFEDATDEYRKKLEDEVENNIENYVEKLNSEYDSGVEYYKNNFGDDAFIETLKTQNLVDFDAVAQYIVDLDGRGIIATYNTTEDVVDTTFKKRKYSFYIYRTE